MVQLIPLQWKSQVYFGILKTVQSHIIKALLHSFRPGFELATAASVFMIYYTGKVVSVVKCSTLVENKLATYPSKTF